ncbi:MAG: alpha/beta hydrolase [Bacteroidales bacterium]|nr:alpha/beta hydrolase [Bacteroidales bacterium]
MKSAFTIFSLSILLAFCQQAAYARPAPVDTVRLWAGTGVAESSEVVMYSYRPENPNGIGVIVCPGGSYYWLDVKGEGLEVAEWLRSNGFTAFVLLYRTAGFGAFFWHYRYLDRGNRHPDMITDAQRALQWVREHSYEYSIDKDKIGMMGFSAGGHLVMSAACFSSTDFLARACVPHGEDLRPAFVAPIYPVVTLSEPYVHKRSRRGLLGDNRQHSRVMIDSLSLERHIPDDCPPVFIVNCKDDPVVDYHNSEILDRALAEKGVPHVYFQYEKGKHGFGVSNVYGTPESRKWKDEFLKWIRSVIPQD